MGDEHAPASQRMGDEHAPASQHVDEERRPSPDASDGQKASLVVDGQVVLLEETPSAFAAELDNRPTLKIAIVVAAVVVALLSFFLAGAYFSQPEAYEQSIASLDQKKNDVTALVAASTAASAAITVIPGDAGTPIAEKLVDLSSDFIIVLTAIYLEKYLLTTLGFAAFKILIPLSCLFVVVAVLLRKRFGARQKLVRVAAKLAALSVVSVLVVPASVFASDMIENTYHDSMEQTINAAKQTTEEVEKQAQNSTEGSGGQAEGGTNASESEAQGFFGSLISRLQELPENISNGVNGLTGDVQNTLNNFIEALAIMIVTSCVIPILVLVFFLWVAKLILGVDMGRPMQTLRPRVLGRPGR